MRWNNLRLFSEMRFSEVPLKPNGVFLISKNGKAKVVTASKYRAANEIYAVQSGPLLLIDGKVHPAFREHSESELIRNGIGVDGEGNVILAMTSDRTRCNLWTFAKLFEHLECNNALFLDGDLSRLLELPQEKISGRGFATLIAVVK